MKTFKDHLATTARSRCGVKFNQSVTLTAGQERGTSSGFTVPPAKRLVIEFVSGLIGVPSGQRAFVSVITSLQTSSFNQLTSTPAGTHQAFAFSEVFTISPETRLYSDPISLVIVELIRNAPTGDALLQLTLSGYLVDVRDARP